MTEEKKRIFYVDGGCSGNNQRTIDKRIMISAVSDEKGKIVKKTESSGGSNNIAEFQAIFDCLFFAKKQGYKKIEILTDSKNNTYWFHCNFEKLLKKKKLNDKKKVYEIMLKIYELKKEIDAVLKWIPRELNKAGFFIEEENIKNNYCKFLINGNPQG